MAKYFSKKAGKHEENRGKVCLWCFKKANRCKNDKFVKITSEGKVEQMINKYVSYNAADDRHLPNAVCNGCRRNLYRMKDGTLNVDDIDRPDFSRFRLLVAARSTSQIVACSCTICSMIKEPLIKKLSSKNASMVPKKSLGTNTYSKSSEVKL